VSVVEGTGAASPPPGTISGLIADYLTGLRLEKIPPAVRRFAKHVLLDCFGCMVSGADTPSGKAALAFARESPLPEASLAAGRERVAVERAAFANTICCNALDFEPVGPEGHVGAVAIPSALALAEWRSASGAALLTAVAAGLEVSGRIGAAWRRPSSAAAGGVPLVRGAPHAVFAAAAAAAVLLELDAEATRNAIGIAGYSAHVPTLRKAMSSLEPPMTKYDHLGGMAQGGIDAARLAQHGFTGDRELFEGELGMWRFSGALGCDWSLLETFGDEFIVAPTFFKSFPCILYENPVLLALRKIVDEHALEPAQIERMILRPSRATKSQHGDGRGGSMAQWMSLRLNAAHAVRGTRPYHAWHDGHPPPADVARLIERTTLEPYVPAKGEKKGLYWEGYSPAHVTVVTGLATYEARIVELKRMTEAELVAKFVENVAPVAGDARAKALAGMILSVESLPLASALRL
jgi:2-methylcitrate dehydratase PrpD